MDSNLCGIGTKFYGKDDIRPNGSFIATKWIVIAYLPIVPLGSFYVRPSPGVTIASSLPPITERVGWQKRHIVNVYAALSAIALSFFMLVYQPTSRPVTAALARVGKGEALPPSRDDLKYARSAAAENGQPFPETSGYIEGYEQLLNEGGSAIVIDNTQNTSDLYAKLYSLDGNLTTPARVFFVQAESRFTVDYLNFGNYELRYQDLDTGGIAKTESLLLEEKTQGGQEYFGSLELTLSKVVNGNLETEPIAKEGF